MKTETKDDRQWLLETIASRCDNWVDAISLGCDIEFDALMSGQPLNIKGVSTYRCDNDEVVTRREY